MVGKAKRRPTNDSADDVEVGSFGGERERERGQRGLAVESGASHAGAGQEVGDGFQSVRGILIALDGDAPPERIGRLSEVTLTQEFGGRRKIIQRSDGIEQVWFSGKVPAGSERSGLL